MALPSFTLPEIKDSDLNSGKERRKILEYLYQLTEQLRYVLANLDEENLAPALAEKLDGSQALAALSGELKDAYGNIASLKRTAQSLSSEISAVDGRVSTVEQTAGKIDWVVKSGTSAANFQMTDRAISQVADSINLSGFVTFSALAGNGTTTINGANIKTGTVAAARIDVDNLYVKHLDGADGDFSGRVTASSGAIGGFTIGPNSLYGTSITLDSASSSISSDDVTTGSLSFGQGRGTTLDLSSNMLGNSLSADGYVSCDTYDYGAQSTYTLRWAGTGGGKIGIATSTIRDKANIRDMDAALKNAIKRLRPVSFSRRKSRAPDFGLIAEEVEAILPAAVIREQINGRQVAGGVDYEKLIVPILAYCQELEKRIEKLEARNGAD